MREQVELEPAGIKFVNPCQAPTHVEECDGIGNELDHFTSRAIAKKLGWSLKHTNSPENLQHLSTPCHREKDRSVPLRLSVLRLEEKGNIFSFEEHKTIFEAGIIVFEDGRDIK